MSSRLGQCFTTCEAEGEIKIVEVQALLRRGLSRFDIIGLPMNMVKEGRDRILSALQSLGFSLPNQRILINLQPSDLPKEGSHFDLPILVALLDALGHLSIEGKKFAWGELLLDGRVESFSNALSHQLIAEAQSPSRLILNAQPKIPARLRELFRSARSEITHCQSLWNLHVKHFVPELCQEHKNPKTGGTAWNELKGSESQFLLFCLAAVGRHHILLEGSPGLGKSFWSNAYKDLLPELSKDQLVERIRYRLSSDDEVEKLEIPFVCPHHSSSMAALVGGGSRKLHLGAITRAHHGVLFLDEFGEFNRQAIEALREPLEKKEICISRGPHSRNFPADIQLIAAMNPCPCGNYESDKLCRCSTQQLDRYRSKVSQAIRQRFHWQVHWRFLPQEPPSLYSWRNVVERLSEARGRQIQISYQVPKKKGQSARELKLEIEKLMTWGKWHGIKRIQKQDYENFLNFEAEWERPYEDQPSERRNSSAP